MADPKWEAGFKVCERLRTRYPNAASKDYVNAVRSQLDCSKWFAVRIYDRWASRVGLPLSEYKRATTWYDWLTKFFIVAVLAYVASKLF